MYKLTFTLNQIDERRFTTLENVYTFWSEVRIMNKTDCCLLSGSVRSPVPNGVSGSDLRPDGVSQKFTGSTEVCQVSSYTLKSAVCLCVAKWHHAWLPMCGWCVRSLQHSLWLAVWTPLGFNPGSVWKVRIDGSHKRKCKDSDCCTSGPYSLPFAML